MALLLLDLDNTVADRAAAFEHWLGNRMNAWELPASARDFVVTHDEDGFRPRIDFLGALRDRAASAGVQSAWLTRGREWARTDLAPDLSADSLTDALRTVNARGPSGDGADPGRPAAVRARTTTQEAFT